MMRLENMNVVKKTQTKKVVTNRTQQIKETARLSRTEKRLKTYAEHIGFIKPELVEEGK